MECVNTLTLIIFCFGNLAICVAVWPLLCYLLAELEWVYLRASARLMDNYEVQHVSLLSAIISLMLCNSIVLYNVHISQEWEYEWDK